MQTHRKRIIKRRARTFLSKVFRLFILFCLTLICLLVFFFLNKNKRVTLVSPIGVPVFHAQSNITGTSTEKLQALLQKNTIAFQSVTASSDASLVIKLKDGQEVIFADNKDLNKQIASLQLIKARLTIEGKRFSRIDFRFDNPVVTY